MKHQIERETIRTSVRLKRIIFAPLFVLLTVCGTSIFAEAQASVKLYPKVIRVQKGKSKTITAAAYNTPTQPNFSATFNFSVGDPSVAGLSPVIVSGDNIEQQTTPPPNLRTVSGNAAGTTTITSIWNGVTSDVATVIVDDPASTPTAIIHGDNDVTGGLTIDTAVGEPIEIDGEASRGVQQIEWTWGDGDKTTELLSATHAYLVAGTYSLALKVTNSAGQVASTSITVNVSPQSQPTQTITVTTIQQLLNAYSNAIGGEHIVIPAGTVLTGEIVLPARNFTDYVTIRSSGSMPDIRDRVSSTQTGMVTLRGSYVGAAPMTIKSGASKIRLAGLKFEPKYLHQDNGPASYYLVQIGEPFTQSDVSQNPTKIIIQHCVINPPNEVNVVHAILNDGYKVSIISSWLGNVKTHGGQDSQAVVSYDGRGAHVYHNNFFEAASENVMYGGVVPKIVGLTSTNIEFRRCYFSKRLSWRVYNGDSHPLNVKNLFETKNARRVYMESTVLENHWDAIRSQIFAFVFKSATSPGDVGEFVPWAISEDIVLENNKVSHIYGGFSSSVDNYWLGPFFGLKPNGIHIKNTLFDDLSQRWGSPGTSNGARFLQPNTVEDLRVDHVTVIDKDQTAGTGIMFASNNNFRFKVSNSIFGLGGYGILGSGAGAGIRALNPGTSGATNGCIRAPGATWTLNNNVLPIYGASTNCYPTESSYRNSFPLNYDSVGFVDLALGDYKLSDSSSYKNTASDGTDPGINVQILNERTACSVMGTTTTCLGLVSAPTVLISGRLTTLANRALPRVRVHMTNTAGETRTATTNQFGYYRFLNVATGDYLFTFTGKNISFASFSRSIFQNTNALNFTSNN